MPSLNSILANARTALSAQQAAVQVTSHNISNAATEGYTRQRPELVTNYPVFMPEGAFGTGVRLGGIGHLRDSLLDTTYRSHQSSYSTHERRSELLSRIEELYGEPSETGLAASLDSFLSAWSDLANNPLNETARAVLRESASRLTGQFHRLAAGLEQVRSSAVTRLEQDVSELNRVTREIADLNVRIVAAEVGGTTAGDLRDMRDRALDRMAELVPVTVVPHGDGSVGVSAQGALLVDGAEAVAVEASSAGGAWSIVSSRGRTLTLTEGSIGATLAALQTDIPNARAELDTLARAIVEDVNALHRTGTNPLAQTDVDFFDPNGLDALTISLSADVTADPRAIAAGTGTVDGGGNPLYQAGTTDIAMAIAALRDATGNPLLGGRSFGDAYDAAVTRVGRDVQSSTISRDTYQALAQQADTRRASVSGVSTDEELVNLIRFQNAYAAAARVVSAADEMLQTVIGMAG